MRAVRTRKSMAAGNAARVNGAEEVVPPAPPAPRVLAGYLRISEDRDGNKIGYEVQRDKVIEWCKYQTKQTGVLHEIGEWCIDRDLTAADPKVKRPEYERMLNDISAGKWSGIAVWRADRLVRLTFEFERCNRIVEEAGAFIVSIDPAFDTRTQWGILIMRLLVMLAEMEIASMKTRARGHHKKKAEEGKYKGGGSRPFGFNRNGVDHNPVEVDLIREAARRVLDEGETYADVIEDWSTRTPPVVGTNGAIFQTTVLINTLTNPRMIGLRAHTTIDPATSEPVTNVYRAEWEPILDEETFYRLEALRKVRTNVGRPAEFNLTGGIAVCGRCGYRLVGTQVMTGKGETAKKVPGYRCESSVSARLNGACGKGTIIAEPVDKQVIALIAVRLKESPDEMKEIASGDDARNTEIADTLEEISNCDAQLDQIRINASIPVLEGGLDQKEVPAHRAPWLQRRAAAEQRLERAKTARRAPQPVGEEHDNLWEWFSAMPLGRRRAFIKAHIRQVKIMPATKRGFFDKTRVVVTLADAQEGDAGR